MKAHIYITGILAAMLIGLTPAKAQRTAQRSQNKNKTQTIKRSEKTQNSRKSTAHLNSRIKAENRKTAQRTTTPRANTHRQVHKDVNSTKVQRSANQHSAKQRSVAHRPEAQRMDHADQARVTRTNPPRKAQTAVKRKAYGNKHSTRNYRDQHYYSGRHYHHVYPEYRIRPHHHHDTYAHHYRVLYYPGYHAIYWTRNMYRDYRRWYPNYHWNYNYGYRIQTISAFDAYYNLGEVARVYGRISGTWYNQDTDDYLLFIGGDYPRHEFTVVVPGRVARGYNWRPEHYFLGEHITVTGLITTYDGIPEIIVKNKRQLGRY